ncbi:protein transport protein Sec24A-like isoform X2 [Ostrea edulis]|uniref:protein transport protein Sec24A-like isoform X2 n=1 Tax=Ostrea edulis TaxID=37623 RepID=UPI0024AEEF6E|nr:protein transport protein Sec24A-like isoform X2 [Ostrea edulis]
MADQHSRYNSSPNGPQTSNPYAQTMPSGHLGGMQSKNLQGQNMNTSQMNFVGNIPSTRAPMSYNASLNGHGTPPPVNMPPMQRMQPPMGLPVNRFQPPMMNVSAPTQTFMNGPPNRPLNANSSLNSSVAQPSLSSSGNFPIGISSAPVPGMPGSISNNAVNTFNAGQTFSHSNSPIPPSLSTQPPGSVSEQRTSSQQRTDTPPTEPTSRKSSRAPSPIETQSYDALEGGDFSNIQNQSFPGSGETRQNPQNQVPPVANHAFSQGNPNRGSPLTTGNPSTAIGGPPSTPRSNPAEQGGAFTSYQSKPGPQGPMIRPHGMSQMGNPQRMGAPSVSYAGQPPRQPQAGVGQQGIGAPGSNMQPTGPQRTTSAPSPFSAPQPMGIPPASMGGYVPPSSFGGQQPPRGMLPTPVQGSFPPTSSSGQQPPVGGPPLSVAGGMYNNPGPPSGPAGVPPPRAPMSSPPGMPPMPRPGPPTGGPPAMPGLYQQPGMLPVSSSAPPTSYGTTQMPPAGFPPQTQPGQIGSTPSRPKYPQMPTSPPTTWQPSQNPPQFSQPGGYQPNAQPGSFPPSQFGSNQAGSGQGGMPPAAPGGFPMTSQPGSLSASFNSMSLQDRVVNLLNEKNLLPPEGMEVVKPRLNNEYKKVNCQADVFRCTLTAIPQTSSLLNKARLPLGILIHPFKDLSQLPVIQSSVIVRCRSCRTYINPFVFFVDSRRWKCNLCYRVNELPDEFSYDPVTKTYGEPQRRPEIKSSTIEFIAPSDYMLRPPQPSVYLFLLDVSFNAVETGYLSIFCQLLLEEMDKLPGDSRTQIGFLAYDKALHFFNLAEGLSQPQMLTVSDIDDIFLPCPDNLLVNLQESKDLVMDLLNQIPSLFEGNLETGSALGAALLAAHKLVSPVGGRVTVMQTVLPTAGPGSLQSREDPSLRSGKNVANLGPAIDFYKKLALDCSAQQVAVDLFMLNGQYADIASISCISKYSGGSVYHYPSFHAAKNPSLSEKYEADLRRYLTRKVGFEAVMRIRCTKGLSIHTFHGNFFVRSTDLLSLPNVNPDAGFGMQMSIEDSLVDTNTVCFQAALLYTSSKGERRIRVHTLCLPVTNQLSEIYAGADQQAIAGLLAKMAVDRSVTSSLSDARDALINAAMDSVASFGSTIPPAQRIGSLPISYTLRMLPVFILALLKSKAFRVGTNTPLDERVFAMQQFKSLPVGQLLKTVYPALYPLHGIENYNTEKRGDMLVPQPPLLHLSSSNIDRTGVYLMDTLDTIYLYIGSAAPQNFIQEVFDVPDFMSIPDGMIDLPELENERSDLMRNFITDLLESRPGGACFCVIRDDSKRRLQFFERMVEDRTESSMSQYEFLQHILKQIKS